MQLVDLMVRVICQHVSSAAAIVHTAQSHCDDTSRLRNDSGYKRISKPCSV